MLKTKAKVGDKIRVVTDILSDGRYSNGDILTIRRIDRDGDYYVEEHDIVMFGREFEVIIEEDEECMTKEDECNTIKMTLPDGTIIEGTAESLADMQRFAGGEDAEESSTKERLKLGDFAKVVGETRYGDIDEGTIVKVTDDE